MTMTADTPIGLPALQARLAFELEALQLPAARWTPVLERDGQTVADVAIVGAGMAGLALAAALRFKGMDVRLYDEAPAGWKAPGPPPRAWRRCARPSSWPGRRWACRR
jgi:FAD-dependent urate hydroxylase